jgi:hypothetical protein
LGYWKFEKLKVKIADGMVEEGRRIEKRMRDLSMV